MPKFVIPLLSTLPRGLRELGRKFVYSYMASDIDHYDQMLELAAILEKTSEGIEFLQRFSALTAGV